jgi:trimethylamine--corrinoid protein Co-methyltransferase
MPELFDNNNIDQWQADGAKDTTARALEKAQQMLRDYEEPALDPATDEALNDFIARREREIPAVDALNTEY